MPNSNASGTSRRLSNLDASWLLIESEVSPMHGGPIFVLKGELPFERLFRHIEERLDIAPRFRQRVVFTPCDIAHPLFADDSEFKLENHVRRRTLPKGISEEDALQEIVRWHFSRVMDRTRPLWDVTLFEGVPDRSFCFFATHHALVDGVSLFDLFNKTLDFTPHPPPMERPAESWRPAPLPNQAELYVNALRDLTVRQIDSAVQAVQDWVLDPRRANEQLGTITKAMQVMNETAQAPIVAAPWNAGFCSGEKKAAWLKMPFADYRAIRTRLEGTVNDIVITILAEAAARYLKYHGWSTQGNLRIGCPVNVRRPEEEVVLENRVSIMMPMTPARPMDVSERLKQLADETRRIKASGAPYLMERMGSLNDSMPPALIAVVSRMSTLAQDAMARLLNAINWRPSPAGPGLPATGINFMASNVPGPQTAWYLAGYEVTDFLPVIMLAGQLGYGVGITSYNDTIYIGMTADSRMMPDVDRMKSFVQEAFDELKSAAESLSRAHPRRAELPAGPRVSRLHTESAAAARGV
jgi:diacylglycerol O-acyltransferase / wax synthase